MSADGRHRRTDGHTSTAKDPAAQHDHIEHVVGGVFVGYVLAVIVGVLAGGLLGGSGWSVLAGGLVGFLCWSGVQRLVTTVLAPSGAGHPLRGHR